MSITAKISAPGVQGPAGVLWSTVNGGVWLTGTAYVRNAGVTRDGSSYRALVDHTAGAANAPGTGADWEEAWQVLALGSSVADVTTVAAIAAEIGVVAGISGDVTAVAGIAADATAVAGNAANITAVAGNATNIDQVAGDSAAINTAADNLAAIIAAPGAASAAAASALAAAASENAAGDSATAAAGSAGAAATSATNAGDSAAAAAASASAADADATQTAADVLSTASNLASTVAAKDLALAAQGGAETAQAGADATKAAMDVALAAVTDYSDTLGLLTGGAKEIVAAADVVAVFIYDTAKDSDGGAWRKRCRHTSWYNETLSTATRGSRRAFPQKALIVARLQSVTIYDLDTAGCPMWMVFNASATDANTAGNFWRSGGIRNASSVSALNGYVYWGLNGSVPTGLLLADLVGDRLARFATTTSIGGFTLLGYGVKDRNLSTNILMASTSTTIVNELVNAVAATVLPGTPIDPVRGLPNPTVAVGTAGGVSVIHWDGRVCNSATTNAINAVSFGLDGTLFYATSASGAIYFSLASEYAAASFAARAYTTAAGNFPVVLAGTTAPIRATPNGFAKGGSSGLTLLRHEPGSGIASGNQSNRSGVAYVTNAYSTGHMVGDIKMALSESTADLTSLVEGTPLNDDFSSYADTTAMLAAGYTEHLSAVATLTTGKMRIENGAATSGAVTVFATGLTIGARYNLAGLYSAKGGGSINPRVYIGTGTVVNNNNLASWQAPSSAAPNEISTSFVASAASAIITFNVNSLTVGAYVELDYFSVVRVASDRSVAANNPRVIGTLTRAAVTSGAELAAYGGFSAANYLEVPYTSGLDFGTGNFAICGWLNLAANSAIETLIERDSGTTAQRWTLQVSAAGLPQWIVDDGTTTVTSAGTVAIDDSRWHFVVAARRGANQELWIDGALVDSDSAPTLTLNNASAVLRVGESVAGGAPLTNGTLALLRIGATAPTPAQIRAIYEDERRLFGASAKCLLPGASVSALAHDDSTDLLHVATTAGSARLRGLLVVDKDATVYTGLDARDGILATRDSGSADIVLPSIPLREASAAGIGHNGGPALYDRRTARAAGVTTNATPTVIARFPMDKGEFGQWVIRTVAREYDGGAELAAYEDVLLARRPGEGNIAISGSVTQRVIQEVTSSMAVLIAANTTTQCIEVTATGVSAKNIEWSVEARLA